MFWYRHQLKVLNAFNKNDIQSYHFIGSSGYGHNDIGKEKISQVFADIFNTESAFVSPLISCGTEAISQSLFGILRPNDYMLAISGRPYDTILPVIGVGSTENENMGSLRNYGVKYDEVQLDEDGRLDYAAIEERLNAGPVKMVYIQRSRGYSLRPTISVAEIKRVVDIVKKFPGTMVMVDNCYGEWTEK